MTKRPRAWLATILVVAAAVSYAAAPSSAAGPQGERVPVRQAPVKAGQAGALRVAMIQEVDSLNPFLAFYLSSTTILRMAYDNLTNYDPKTLKPSESLATKWTVAKDKLTWTYTIRKDAKWSDGQPVTARDIAFTFNLMMKDSDARTANGSYVANFASVTATNPETLVIKTKKPSATMLSIGVPIVPEHIWKDVKDIGDFKHDKFPLVGSGPFTIVEHKTGQHVRLKANKNYWLGAPKIDELVFLFYKNTDAAVQALRGGEADLIHTLTAAQFDSLKNAGGVTQHKGQGRRFYELSMNPGAATVKNKPIGDGHPALKDVRLRQAVHRAIDKKALVDRVLNGYGELGAGYIPPLFKDYHWAPQPNEAIGFNLAEANRLLDQAGYKRGSDGVRRMPDGGRKLEFRLSAHASRADDSRLADHIKGWLKDIGITIKTRVMEDNKLNEGIAAGRYDMALGGWSVNPDPDFILSIQTCAQRPEASGKGGTTDNFACDSEYDALYKQQAAELDPARRADIVKRMQARFYTQSTSVILFYPNVLEAYRGDRFGSFQTMPDPGGLIYGQDGYWSFVSVAPASASDRIDDEDGIGGLTWGIAGAAALVIAAGAYLYLRRRRASAGERE